MSSGISTQGSRGLSATGAVSLDRTCAVVGSSDTPLSFTSTGTNRTRSIATAGRTRPAGLFAIVQNDVQAMAPVCRACVAKPNVRRTGGIEIPRIILPGDRSESAGR